MAIIYSFRHNYIKNNQLNLNLHNYLFRDIISRRPKQHKYNNMYIHICIYR